jgi:hypothetical protein
MAHHDRKGAMTTIPTGRLSDTEAEKKAKLRRGSKLRVIDTGSVYDITGKLRTLIRQIENEKFGKATDVIAAIRFIKGKKIGIETIYYGTSQSEVLHFMACRLEKETN